MNRLLVYGKTFIQKWKTDNRGMTLVEMIVTFAILGLFMVAGTQLIASTMNVYFKVKGENNGLQVSTMLMDRIRGELENAQNSPFLTSDEEETVAVSRFFANDDITHLAVIVGKDDTSSTGGSLVEFTNAKNSHVAFYLVEENGHTYLSEYYYPIMREKVDAEGNPVLDEAGDAVMEEYFKALDWKYDTAAYMGYYVDSITFTKMSDLPEAQRGFMEYPDNVIRIELVLASDRYGTYTTTDYVKLHQFPEEAQMVTLGNGDTIQRSSVGDAARN